MAVNGVGRVSMAHVPSFVRAKTAQKLTEEMLANNVKLKAFVTYFDIQFVQGYWYAWYVLDIERL